MSLVKNLERSYYKPDIEEFHVGFEYEKWNTKSQEFESCVIEKIFQINNADILLQAVGMRGVGWQVRVKHLDIQDVIDLGLELVGEVDDNGEASFRCPNNPGWWLTLNGTKVWIEDADGVVFYGHVKSKSELEQVLKQVGYEMEQ